MPNDSVKVKILTTGTIPIFGRGPKLQPVTMSLHHYELLLSQGIKMEIVGDKNPTPIKVKQPEKPKPSPAPTPEPPKQPEMAAPLPPTEPPKKSEATEESPVVTEKLAKKKKSKKEVVEIPVDDENLSAEAYYTSNFLTKKKCYKILSARKIEPDQDGRAEVLKDQVLKSNPEVENPPK